MRTFIIAFGIALVLAFADSFPVEETDLQALNLRNINDGKNRQNFFILFI
jgi:hypothetical protein